MKSVSVILNGADLSKLLDASRNPSDAPVVDVASPINLLNPDRYEFYSFNENGDLIKRIMTTPEVQSIVAGHKAMDKVKVDYKIATNSGPPESVNGSSGDSDDVNDIVQNVQNILNTHIRNGANITEADADFLPAVFDSKTNETRPIVVIKHAVDYAAFSTESESTNNPTNFADALKSHSSHNKHNKTHHHHHQHHQRPGTPTANVTMAPATEPPVTVAPTVATMPPATEPPATEPPATDPPATDPPATDPPATTTTMAPPPAVDPTTTTTAAADTTTAMAARDDSAAVGANGFPTEQIPISVSVTITDPPRPFAKLSVKPFDSNFSLSKIIESLTTHYDATNDTEEPLATTTISIMPAEMMDESTEPITDHAPVVEHDQKTIDMYSILIPRNKYASNGIVAAAPAAASDTDIKTTDLSNTAKPLLVPIASASVGTPIELKIKGDILKLARICNDLAFAYWKSYASSSPAISSARSVLVSPFSLSATLAMLYLGARGNTSEELNDILHLDDIVSSNPHQLFSNVYESVTASNAKAQSVAGIVQYLYSDRTEGQMMPFYKEKAFQYYGAIAEEIAFETLYEKLKYSTNTLMKRFADAANNLAQEYFKFTDFTVSKPLVAVSANIFQTDCSAVSHSGRDGKMLIHVRSAATAPNAGLRRVLSVPAVVWKTDFMIGHDVKFNTSVISLGASNQILRTVLVMPSVAAAPATSTTNTKQPSTNAAAAASAATTASTDVAEQFERFERDFVDRATSRSGWQRVFGSLKEPAAGTEVQIPRFTHQSHVNATAMLRQMGLRSLFEARASDLRGITGRLPQQLYMSDVLQLNSFSVCDEYAFGTRNYVDTYPTGGAHVDDAMLRRDVGCHAASLVGKERADLPLPLRPREARHPEPAGRLVVDRPFLFYVIHNPTGTILHMGRFYPNVN